MKAPTPCGMPNCYEYVTANGRCAEHQRPVWQGSYRRQRLPKDWNTRRDIVLRRDNYICYVCGGLNADTVDHIKAGDDHSTTNLAAIHDKVFPHCHRYKTAAEGHDAKRGYRPKH